MRTPRSVPALSALSFAALVSAALVGATAAGENTATGLLGKEAPAFSLPDTQGKMHSLAESGGSKATVIIFVSTQCPVSNAYNERMEAVAKDYASKGVTVLAIYSNKAEGIDEIASHAKTHGFTFTTLKDEGNVIADKYGANVTPEVFVVDPKGIVRYHGRIDDSQKESGVTSKDLRAALDAMLAGQEVAKNEAKAFGCTIKRVAKAGA